jgi:hypothetical protein
VDVGPDHGRPKFLPQKRKKIKKIKGFRLSWSINSSGRYMTSLSEMFFEFVNLNKVFIYSISKLCLDPDSATAWIKI